VNRQFFYRCLFTGTFCNALHRAITLAGMVPGFQLMTLFASCAALNVSPTRSLVKPFVARRTALLVMDEEKVVFSVPLTDVKAAAAEIKEVLAKDADVTAPTLAALTEEKNALYAALLHGYDADKVKRMADVEAMIAAAAALQDAALRPEEATIATAASPKVVALTKEMDDLYAALEHGYDADKVKRLAEVEQELAAAGGPASEAATLSPEEAAKAAWLARTRPSWGGKGRNN
jgi:hypothetical protein